MFELVSRGLASIRRLHSFSEPRCENLERYLSSSEYLYSVGCDDDHSMNIVGVLDYSQGELQNLDHRKLRNFGCYQQKRDPIRVETIDLL